MLAALGSGCAALTVHGPSGTWTPQSGRAPVCDDRAGGPIVGDVLLATTVGLVGLAGAVDLGCDPMTDFDCKNHSTGGAAAVGIGTAAVVGAFVYSIVVGSRRAAACRAALMDWTVQLQRR